MIQKKHLLLLSCCLCLSFTLLAKSPKYVFIFIGDGMGAPCVQATNLYKQMVLPKEGPLLMTQFPVAGLVTTHCLNNLVTDSPAAGTAIANGVKTQYTFLGVDKNQQPLKSFFQVMKEQGKGIALLTTNAPDDATPAAFYASVPKRSHLYQIDTDMANSNFDFFAGARLRGDFASDRKEKPVYEMLQEKGYTIAEGMEAFDKVADKDKIILLSTDTTELNAVGLVIDQNPNALRLSEMTNVALRHLDKRYHKKGFCMMVEAGDIDHTNHVKDLAGTVHEILEFDKAVRVAYEFYQKHPQETLILITADHETGGFTIGVDNSKQRVNLKALKYQKISEISFGNELDKCIKNKEAMEWPDMRDYLKEKFGFWVKYQISLEEEAQLMLAFNNACIQKGGKGITTLYNSFNEFTLAVFNLLNHKMGIGWTTWSHTGNQVPFFAIGQGSEAYTGYLDNTDLVNKLYQLMNLRNPNLTK